ncbi:MAG: flagellar biosynthetic protein FliR [Deltaproteobacteria bacterium]|nr:flagellar biosynthetic protein FliR [Deltaproteobacteria bacterium]
MNQLTHQLGINVDWRFMMTFAGLIMTRLVMVTLTIPFLTGKPAPAQIKMGLAVALLIFLYPFLAPAHAGHLPQDPVTLMLLFVKEAFYGILIGFAGSIVFQGFEAAGAVIDNQRGAAQARLLIPQLSEQTSLFGLFNIQLGIVIFLSVGGHILFFRTLMESYTLLPILEFPKAQPDFLAMADQIIRMTGQVLFIAAAFSAPVMLCVFITDLILGIMNRVAPAINVWEMGFTIRGYLGVLVLFLCITLIAGQMEKYSLGMVTDLEKVIRFLAVSSNG